MTTSSAARRNRSIAGAAVAVSLVLAACGGGTGSGTGGEAEGGSSDPITWMSILHTPATPESDGEVKQQLEEITGEAFSVQWVPDASKDEKLNAALASNTLSDITSLTRLTSSTTRNALTAGTFWDVEEYLPEFENLSAIDPKTLDAARVDGKLYGVPFQKPLARFGLLVRQDWLDNLGLEAPHTIEELEEVARAFTEDDPDGNGADDTVGFIDRDESFLWTFRLMAGVFGAGDTFELDDDGNVVATFTTDAWKEAMEWYHDAYANGWVNQEFVTMQKQNQQDAFAQGKGGISYNGLMEARTFMAVATSADPETPMEWTLINDLTYEDVPRRVVSDTGGGMGGLLAISKANVETEDELRRVLGFIDKLLTEEAFNLMTSGIEGTHYTLSDDDVVTITDPGTWEQEVQPWTASRPSDLVVQVKSADEYVNMSNELIADNAEYAVTNIAQSLSSPTYDTQWSLIEQSVTDAYNKYVMGQIDMAGYEQVIEDARASGLDDIEAEFTEGYKEFGGTE